MSQEHSLNYRPADESPESSPEAASNPTIMIMRGETQEAAMNLVKDATEGDVETPRPTVLMPYRNNDSFAKMAPQIVDALTKRGWNVETVVFAEGTPEEKIKKWTMDHAADLQDKLLVSDHTFYWSGADKDLLEKHDAGRIDHIIESALMYAMQHEPWYTSIEETFENRYKKEPAEIYKALQTMFAEVMRKSGKPDIIVIQSDRLKDHIKPVGGPKEKINPDDPFFRYVERNRIYGELMYEDSLNFPIAEDVKNMFVEMGTDPANIYVAPRAEDLRDAKDRDQWLTTMKELHAASDSIWFLRDRHVDAVSSGEDNILKLMVQSDMLSKAATDEERREIRWKGTGSINEFEYLSDVLPKMITIRLPIESTMEDLRNRGLVKIDDTALSEELSRQVEKYVEPALQKVMIKMKDEASQKQ